MAEHLKAIAPRAPTPSGAAELVVPDRSTWIEALDRTRTRLAVALQREIDLRYLQVVEGIEAQPILRQRAPRFVYVLGEVVNRVEGAMA